MRKVSKTIEYKMGIKTHFINIEMSLDELKEIIDSYYSTESVCEDELYQGLKKIYKEEFAS